MADCSAWVIHVFTQILSFFKSKLTALPYQSMSLIFLLQASHQYQSHKKLKVLSFIEMKCLLPTCKHLLICDYNTMYMWAETK